MEHFRRAVRIDESHQNFRKRSEYITDNPSNQCLRGQRFECDCNFSDTVAFRWFELTLPHFVIVIITNIQNIEGSNVLPDAS